MNDWMKFRGTNMSSGEPVQYDHGQFKTPQVSQPTHR